MINMDEEIIIVELETSESNPVDTIESEVYAEHQDVTKVIEVMSEETVTVDVDEAFTAFGEPNEALIHSLLTNRDGPDQHPIVAISGLREELDSIEALQTVYSNEKHQADYYEWEDGNPLQENRVGYFVSVGSTIRVINICEGTDVFGVTVDKAAFVGGQDDVVRDCKYGLVVHSGVVNVRCELDVNVGDYIVSNSRGEAKKTESQYGCKVTDVLDIEGTLYATIALNIPIDQMEKMGKDNIQIHENLDKVSRNANAAINTANKALNTAEEAIKKSDEASKNASDAIGKADQIGNSTSASLGEMSDKLTEALANVERAQSIVNDTLATAQQLRDEAVAKSAETQADLSDLIEELEPIRTWSHEDPNTGDISYGADYFVQYVKDGLATRSEVLTANNELKDELSAVSTNAAGIESMVMSIDKYSVGPYSQAYGLTKEQAKSILKVGTIYIPTENRTKCCDVHDRLATHCEQAKQEKLDEDGNVMRDEDGNVIYEDQLWKNEFTPTFYYEWNGEDWSESLTDDVVFVHDSVPEIYPPLKFWYIDSDTAPDGYEPYGLYKVTEVDGVEQWKLVNTLSGNVTSRVSSLITQKTNEISLEIVGINNAVADIDAIVDGHGSSITSLTSWAKGEEGGLPGAYNLAAIEQTANEAGASASLVASQILTPYITIEESFEEYLTNPDNTIDPKTVYYSKKEKFYYYYDTENTTWIGTSDPKEAGLKINASSIVTAINDSESSVFITGNHIILNGLTTNGNASFGVTKDGDMWATGGVIGGWEIDEDHLTKLSDVHKRYYTKNDARQIFRYAIGHISSSTDSWLTWADVNGDGVVDIDDVKTILDEEPYYNERVRVDLWPGSSDYTIEIAHYIQKWEEDEYGDEGEVLYPFDGAYFGATGLNANYIDASEIKLNGVNMQAPVVLYDYMDDIDDDISSAGRGDIYLSDDLRYYDWIYIMVRGVTYQDRTPTGSTIIYKPAVNQAFSVSFVDTFLEDDSYTFGNVMYKVTKGSSGCYDKLQCQANESRIFESGETIWRNNDVRCIAVIGFTGAYWSIDTLRMEELTDLRD